MVISPHLDDAVLGCGALLAGNRGSVVLTALAGVPHDEAMSTEWDRACGFASAAQAVAARREEDRAALRRLGAEPVWLGFCDGQYGETPAVESLAWALQERIAQCRPQRIAMPLGLFHSDHRLVAQACLLAWQREPDGHLWLAYEDGLYRRLPGLVQRRLRELDDAGVRLTPDFPAPGDGAAKREAALCYASQWRPLRDAGHVVDAEMQAPERCWRLEAAHD